LFSKSVFTSSIRSVMSLNW